MKEGKREKERSKKGSVCCSVFKMKSKSSISNFTGQQAYEGKFKNWRDLSYLQFLGVSSGFNISNFKLAPGWGWVIWSRQKVAGLRRQQRSKGRVVDGE